MWVVLVILKFEEDKEKSEKCKKGGSWWRIIKKREIGDRVVDYIKNYL